MGEFYHLTKNIIEIVKIENPTQEEEAQPMNSKNFGAIFAKKGKK